MDRRQLLRVAGAASGLALANTAAADSTGYRDAAVDSIGLQDDDCQRPECLHPILGYTGFETDDVADLPDDLQPDHEVELVMQPRDSDEADDQEDDEADDRENDEADDEERDRPPIPEFFFEPTGLAIEEGDVVQFTLESPDHTVTAFHPDLGRQRRVPEGVPPFSSAVLGGDAFWLYRFDDPGVYDLLCSPHEVFGMVMRIVVDDPEEGFGEAEYPSRRGPELTASLVLDDDALDPEHILERGEVGWNELDDENKRLLIEIVSPPGAEDAEEDDEEAEEGEDETEDEEEDDVIEENGLVILEHELVEDGFLTAVEGILANDTGGEVGYVQVTVTFYDDEGVRIDDSFTNTTDLDDGEEWAFEVTTTESIEDIADYEIEISDSPF